MNDPTQSAVPPPPLDTLMALRSPTRRLGFMAVGTAAGIMAVGILMLWATEPQPLPSATQGAFAGTVIVALAWVAYAVWGLSRRSALLARDRIVGGVIAEVASVATTGFAVIIAIARGNPLAAVTALVTGAVFLSASGMLTIAGRREHRRLLAVQAQLEVELAHRETSQS